MLLCLIWIKHLFTKISLLLNKQQKQTFEIHRQLLITGHEERKEIGNGLIHVHKISHIHTKIHDADPTKCSQHKSYKNYSNRIMSRYYDADYSLSRLAVLIHM